MLSYLSKSITNALAVSVMVSCFTLPAFAASGNLKLDSDGDGITDVIENRHGLDPHKPYDAWRDDDEDHLPNIVEFAQGRDINSKDNDIFTYPHLFTLSAVADIHSKVATKAQLKALQPLQHKPVALYEQLLDEVYFSRMGFIGRVYQGILFRSPDLDGARYYHHMLGEGMSKLDMVEQFLGSKEFQKTYGKLDNASFIDLAHLNVIGRAPSSDEFEYYTDLVNSDNLSRAQLLLLFIESDEFVQSWDWTKRLEMLSLLITGQIPSRQQMLQYLDYVEQEQQMTSVLRSLLASDAFSANRVIGLPPASSDTDLDGITNGVEFVDGTRLSEKDNDVLGSDRAFVRQMLRDIKGEVYSSLRIDAELSKMRNAASRAQWLLSLLAANGKWQQNEWLNTLLPGQKLPSVAASRDQHNVAMIEAIINSSQFQDRFY